MTPPTQSRRSHGLYGTYRRALMFCKRLRYGLERVHPTFFMSGHSTVAPDLVAEEYAYIGPGCRICPRVRLGRYVMFGPNVTVTGSDHRFDVAGTPMIFAGRPPLRDTVVEADVWVGDGALIMAGVTLGRGSIVAARAIVTADVPPYEIHGGIPARKIRNRFPSEDEIRSHDAMLQGPPMQGEFAQRLGAEHGV